MKSFLEALQTGDAVLLGRWLAEGMSASKPLTVQRFPLKQSLPLAIVLENIPLKADLHHWQQCIQLLTMKGARFADIAPSTMNEWQPRQTLLHEFIASYRGPRSTSQRHRLPIFDSGIPPEVTPEEIALNALWQWIMHEIITQTPDELERADSSGNPPLLAALFEGKVELAKMFIKAGADVTRRSPVNNSSALHYASHCEGAEEIMDMLLARGVPLDSENQQQQTALEVCHITKNILFLLQKGAALRRQSFMRIWHLAEQNSDSDLISHLLKHTDAARLSDPQGRTLLHEIKSADLIPELISAGADVNATDTTGCTPLLCALGSNADLTCVEALLAHGADVNQADTQGLSPLTLLIQYNIFGAKTVSLLQTMQQYGVQLDSRDDKGNSLLHLALFQPPEVLQFLLDQGLFINARDAQGRTPLHLAVEQRRWIQTNLLLMHGADPALADAHQLLPLEYFQAIFFENDPLFKKNIGPLLAPFSSAKIPKNYTDLFHLAVQWNDTDLLAELFTLRPPPPDVLAQGLRIAVAHRSYAAVEWLLAREVKPETQEHEPLLHLAVRNFDLKMVDMLMNAGADVQVRDQSQRTPFDIWIDAYQSPSSKMDPQEHVRLAYSIFALLVKKLPPTHPLLIELIPILVVYPRVRPWRILQFLILNGTPLPLPSTLPLEHSFASRDNFHTLCWPILIKEAVINHDLTLLTKLFGLLKPALKKDYLALAAYHTIEKLNWPVFELLIQLGFEVNHPVLDSAYSKERTHTFALLFASVQKAHQSNDSLRLQSIETFMIQLLNAGFSNELLSRPRYRGYSFSAGSLHHAVGYNMLGLVARLLDPPQQLDPDFLSNNKTPLEVAVTQKHVAMAELLLQRGANPKRITADKKTLLHLACESKNEAMIRLLFAANPVADKKTIEIAMQYKLPIALFELLWQACPPEQLLQIKPLLLATGMGHLPFVECILQKASTQILEQVNLLGQTALHIAARFPDPALFNLLLSRNFSPTARDYLGDTPAMIAFYHGTFSVLGLTAPAGIEFVEFELLQAQLREQPEFSWDGAAGVLGKCCFKLISLFRTRARAVDFLKRHQDAASSQQPVHDACLFSLPETGEWHQDAWAALAYQHGSALTRHLHLAPSIENALGHSPVTLQEIERTNIRYTREAEDQALAALFSRHRISEPAFNRVRDRFVPNEEDHMPSLFIDGADFKEPRYYLTKLEKHDRRGFILGALTHCCQSVGAAGEACTWYGMTSAFSGFYVVFKRSKAKDIQRLSKLLSTAEQKNCVRDFLGALAEKTQRKKYQDWCAEEARKQQVSADSLHILRTLRTHLTEQLQQAQEDQIVAQMWAWRNEKSLVFDSWERLRPEDDRLCLPFVEAAAKLAIQKYGFKRVLLGKNGNTPANLPFPEPVEVEYPVEYFDYRDSQEQWLVGECLPEPERLSNPLYALQVVFAQNRVSSQNEREATL